MKEVTSMWALWINLIITISPGVMANADIFLTVRLDEICDESSYLHHKSPHPGLGPKDKFKLNLRPSNQNCDIF